MKRRQPAQGRAPAQSVDRDQGAAQQVLDAPSVDAPDQGNAAAAVEVAAPAAPPTSALSLASRAPEAAEAETDSGGLAEAVGGGPYAHA